MSVMAVTVSTRDDDTQTVQVWDLEFIGVTKKKGPLVVAMINAPGSWADRIYIRHLCPAGWIDSVLRLFSQWREGRPITATHVLSWDYSKPVLTPIELPPEPAATEEPLDLDEWMLS